MHRTSSPPTCGCAYRSPAASTSTRRSIAILLSRRHSLPSSPTSAWCGADSRPEDASGRFVAGTAGYIAPEQVLDPVELDPRADIYALAGTLYNVTTGRAFFDDIDSARDRIVAHMKRDPFEDPARLESYPAAIARLLRAATARAVEDRPSPLEFGREFAASL